MCNNYKNLITLYNWNYNDVHTGTTFDANALKTFCRLIAVSKFKVLSLNTYVSRYL